MREYRLTPFWRFVSYLLAIAFFILAIYWLIKPLSNPFRVTHVLNYIGSSLLLVIVYGLYREARYGKLIINFVEEEITLISSFTRRTLPFKAIKGYRIVDSYFFIMPTSKKFKRIRLAMNMENSIEIEKWLYHNYPDIAELEAQEDYNEIAQSEELGITEEARFLRVNEAKKVATTINTVAWIVLVWVLFFPRPYPLATTAGILVPLLTLLICYYYNGLMKGGDKEKSGYPSVAIAYVLPGMALLLRALLDYTILSYRQGWIPIVLLTSFMCIFYLLPTQGFKPKNATDYIFLALLPFLMFIYSFGAIILINSTADSSTPERYQTTVISKYKSSGKISSYYLTVKPWGTLQTEQTVTVKHPLYNQIEANDTVTVIQHKGYWRMPWVIIEDHY